MLNKRIERTTINILQEFNVTKLPIPLDSIIQKRGLTIKEYDLGVGVSGVLLINKGSGVIGVNPDEPKVRQRFTKAHELGHYELHRHNSALFIDKGFLNRDKNSSTGEILVEQEANAFAAALLMPEYLLEKEIKKQKLDLSDDNAVIRLADTFEVSSAAMTYRIANLNLYWKLGF